MDVDYFNEIVFEKLRAKQKGIVLELSNGNQKQFTKEDVMGCSLYVSHGVFCIEDWCFDVNHIVAICYNNPLDELQEALGL